MHARVAANPIPVMTQAELFAEEQGARAGSDWEGDAFCAAVSAAERRAEGITFTPAWLVELMLERAAALEVFDTVVDAGAGSGRFTFAALARFPHAKVLAIERNGLLADLLRRRARREGYADRVHVIEGDFRCAPLPLTGRTLFIGNPPYVRHHDIESEWKDWYRNGMAQQGIGASQLAGLHSHFLLRTVQVMRPGDAGRPYSHPTRSA